jgi:GTP-binding protein
VPNAVRIDATFVTSAAGPEGFPREGTPELAIVGRSNVGKSSLINALTGLRLARISVTPGKTRLVNIFRVAGATDRPFLLVDLPGYGYARGARDGAFEALTEAYFLAPRGGRRHGGSVEDDQGLRRAAVLLVDARHPGLEKDLAAYDWLASLDRPAAVVATKLDKLTRAERTRGQQALESAFNGPVLPVSAASGEGLKDLWRLIARLLSNHPPRLTPRLR